jgi:hypothetical protein
MASPSVTLMCRLTIMDVPVGRQFDKTGVYARGGCRAVPVRHVK